MADILWTPAMVEDRFDEAADVMRRLPASRVQGFFSLWPAIAPSFDDLVGQTPRPMSRGRPSPEAIDRMDVTLTWLRWLEPDDAKLVWLRAERTPWKPLCSRFTIARSTAHRRHQYALSVIAWRLSGRRVPTKRSMEFLIDKARGVSGQSNDFRQIIRK